MNLVQNAFQEGLMDGLGRFWAPLGGVFGTSRESLEASMGLTSASLSSLGAF